MCEEEAFKWWNSIVYEDSDNSAQPTILSPEDASLFLVNLSPILHNHTDYNLSQDDYWKQAYDVIYKLTKENSIPDPNSDFSGFVVFLYNHRNIIKPNTLETCLMYVDRFCPSPPGDFFIKDLQFSISNPELCVKTLQKLHHDKDERWLSCLSQHGFIDRTFDLFIPFLLIFEKSLDQFFSFRIDVADFLVNILEYNPGILTEQMYSALYSRVVSSIEKAPPAEGYTFLRCAVRINEKTIKQVSKEQQHNRMKSLLLVAKMGSPNRIPIYRYVMNNLEYIDIYEVIKTASRFLPRCTADIEILIAIAEKDTSGTDEIPLLVVKALCRILMQSKIFMRAAATLLIEFLDEHAGDEIVDWVKAFIRRCFIFMKFCILKNKYLNRVLMICSIISSTSFSSIDWLAKAIKIDASECYRDNISFLSDYFEITKETDDLFKREVIIFTQAKVNLKYFPFRSDGTSLTENHQTREYMAQKSQIDERLLELNIDPNICKFLYYDPEASHSDQQQSEFQLEDIAEEQRGIRAECEKLHLNTKYPLISRYRTEGEVYLIGAILAFKESENAVWDFRRRAIDEYLEQLNEIQNVVNKNRFVMPNIKLITQSFNMSVNESSKYRLLKQRRHATKRYTMNVSSRYNIPNYESLIIGEITTSVFKYNSELNYFPPSLIDEHTKEFLFRTDFCKMLDAAATVFIDGTINASTSTLQELTSAVCEHIGRTGDQAFSVMYTSILRCIFDIAFQSSSILNKYDDANAEYLELCNKFIQRQIGNSGIPECVIGSMRRRASIQTLFRSKKLGSFQNLEYMVNPLDMFYHVYSTMQNLDSAVVVPGAELTSDERLIVAICVICNSPPTNAISIIKFMKKWEGLIQSPQMIRAFHVFKRASDRILASDEIIE